MPTRVAWSSGGGRATGRRQQTVTTGLVHRPDSLHLHGRAFELQAIERRVSASAAARVRGCNRVAASQFPIPQACLEGPNCQTCAASTARRGATPPTPAAVTRPPRAGWTGRQLACSASARRFKPPLRFSAPGNLSQYCGPCAHDRCFELVLVREAAFPMRSAQSACGRVGRRTRGRAKRAP